MLAHLMKMSVEDILKMFEKIKGEVKLFWTILWDIWRYVEYNIGDLSRDTSIYKASSEFGRKDISWTCCKYQKA